MHARFFALPAFLLAGCMDAWFIPLPPKESANTDTHDSSTPVDSVGDTSIIETGLVETGIVESCPDPDALPGIVEVDSLCYASLPPGPPLTARIEWSSTLSVSLDGTPVVGNLDDDDGDGDIDANDSPDVVVMGGGIVYSLSGVDGSEQWAAECDPRGGYGATCALGQIDGVDGPEVACAGTSGVCVFHGDGTPFWSAQPSGWYAEASGGAVGIADLRGDGSPEVIFGKWIFNGMSGALQGLGMHGSGTGYDYDSSIVAVQSVAVDIDGDLEQELIVGNAAYDEWGFDEWYNGGTDGYVAVGDMDGDGGPEIVVSRSCNIRLQDQDGAVIWEDDYCACVNCANASGTPVIADFEGDGEPEIGVSTADGFMVLEADGSIFWRNLVESWSASVYDLDADGVPEVLIHNYGRFVVLDGASGDVELDEPWSWSGTFSGYPAVADIDHDGEVEIVISSIAVIGDPYVGVIAIGSDSDPWAAGRPVWNQHAWSLTNADDDLGIPAIPTPSWAEANTFRAGAAVHGDPQPNARVTVSACLDECPDGIVRLDVRLENAGLGDLPEGVGFLVADYASGRVIGEGAFPAVPTGTSSPVQRVDLLASDVPSNAVSVVVDGAGTIDECSESDNGAVFPVACP